MYLYRVEHKKTREGPYAYIGPMQDTKPHLYMMKDHPSPYDEGLDFWMGINQCGFESKKKLLDWFTIKDLEDFAKDNLHVYKIHTEERWVEKGERQLIFNPDFNYYRKRIPLKDLKRYCVSLELSGNTKPHLFILEVTVSHNLKDLTGQRFGKLLVLRRSKRKSDKHGQALWDCQCECGVVKMIRGGHLKCGDSVSCGCYKRLIHSSAYKNSLVISTAGVQNGGSKQGT